MANKVRLGTLSATTLIGDPVRNSEGDALGKIEDFMIDLDSGCIAYAVLSFGGFLGLGISYLPSPGRHCALIWKKNAFGWILTLRRWKKRPVLTKTNGRSQRTLAW